MLDDFCDSRRFFSKPVAYRDNALIPALLISAPSTMDYSTRAVSRKNPLGLPCKCIFFRLVVGPKRLHRACPSVWVIRDGFCEVCGGVLCMYLEQLAETEAWGQDVVRIYLLDSSR